MSNVKEVTQTELCKILGLSRQSIWDYTQKGIFKKLPNGKYNAADCINAYIKYKTQKFEEKIQRMESEEAERRKKIAEARLKELELAEREEKLVDVDKVKDIWIKHITNTKQKLLSLPGKAAPLVYQADNINEIQQILHDIIIEALEELSNGDEDV